LANPLAPPYLARFINGIPVGDSQPELDEPFAGINTLTNVAMLEGFIDVLGPVNPTAVKNEGLNIRHRSDGYLAVTEPRFA
jgi:hypothetical protein